MSKNLLIQGISVAKLPNIMTNVAYRSAIMILLKIHSLFGYSKLKYFFSFSFFFSMRKTEPTFSFYY